jgi:hypothetical protein
MVRGAITVKAEHVLPSQKVCAQLDIKHEELEDALRAVEEITGCKPPRRPCLTPIGYIESAVALELCADHGLDFAAEELQYRLDELREHCGSAVSYLRSIEATYALVGSATSMDVRIYSGRRDKIATFDAARDAATEAIRRATHAADTFQIDWERRRAVARLGGTPPDAYD